MKKFLFFYTLLFFILTLNSLFADSDFHETGQIDIGMHCSYLTLSPDGKNLFIVNDLEVGQNSDNKGSIFVYNTEDNTHKGTIDLDAGIPFQIDISPDNKFAYLAVSKRSGNLRTSGANRVDIIDLQSYRIIKSIFTGGSEYGPIGLKTTPDGSKVIVSHRGSNIVFIINTSTNEIIKSISLNRRSTPIDLDVTPDSNRAYVANRYNSTVSLIDIKSNKLLTNISLSLPKSGSTTSIKITANGKFAYVTYSESNSIAVVDTNPESVTYNKQIKVIRTTGGKLGSVAILDDKLILVADRENDEIVAIDINPNSINYHKEIDRIEINGENPYDIIIQELPFAVAYASTSSTISIIDYFFNHCTDTDSDGVIDQWDKCPETPLNSYVNRYGCPENDNSAIAGRITIKGHPLNNGTATLIQSGELFQKSSLDNNGYFKFNRVSEDKSINIMIRRSVEE